MTRAEDHDHDPLTWAENVAAADSVKHMEPELRRLLSWRTRLRIWRRRLTARRAAAG